jgi:hypothetical protein
MTDKIIEVEQGPDGELVFRLKLQGLPFVPEESRRHLRSARKEFLLALRSLLDRSIERAEKAEEKKEKKKTKIEIQ